VALSWPQAAPLMDPKLNMRTYRNDFFITKYDASGVKQWTRQLGTAGNESANALTSDAAGNVYATGYTDGALDGQTSAGSFDFCIVKYQADGRKR